eukprot:763598-Hanusia_phi.AAC.1
MAPPLRVLVQEYAGQEAPAVVERSTQEMDQLRERMEFENMSKIEQCVVRHKDDLWWYWTQASSCPSPLALLIPCRSTRPALASCLQPFGAMACRGGGGGGGNEVEAELTRRRRRRRSVGRGEGGGGAEEKEKNEEEEMEMEIEVEEEELEMEMEIELEAEEMEMEMEIEVEEEELEMEMEIE